jgi:hypothetical protein
MATLVIHVADKDIKSVIIVREVDIQPVIHVRAGDMLGVVVVMELGVNNMKQYKFKCPELFNLPEGEYLVKESDVGYNMQVTEKNWFGFPKWVVENGRAFEYAGEFKKKRLRIKKKSILK